MLDVALEELRMFERNEKQQGLNLSHVMGDAIPLLGNPQSIQFKTYMYPYSSTNSIHSQALFIGNPRNL